MHEMAITIATEHDLTLTPPIRLDDYSEQNSSYADLRSGLILQKQKCASSKFNQKT